MKQLGYNFIFKFNNKRIAGTTQDDLDIQPVTKESTTKSDQGETQYEVVGHNVNLTVAGLIDIDASDSTNLDADDLMDLALAKGASAVVPFAYVRGSGQAYYGNAICDGYSESTNSEDFGGFSMKFRVTGTLSKTQPQ